jgi:hypothetical protein
MKNINLIPTKIGEGSLFIDSIDNKLILKPDNTNIVFKDCKYYHIYITSDVEIKENVYCLINGVLCKTELLDGRIVSRQLNGGATMDICKSEYSEIILTTDQSLDGVQAIDDEFLEWFVKNPSCEWVELGFMSNITSNGSVRHYKIILPKEGLYYITKMGIAVSNEMARATMIPKEYFGKQELDCPYDFTSRCTVGRCDCKPKQETLEEYISEVTKNFGDEMSIKFTSGGIKLGAKWQAERMYSEEDMELAWEEGNKDAVKCMANGKDKKCYCTNEIHCHLLLSFKY